MSDPSQEKVAKVISGKNTSEYQRWDVPNVKRLKQQALKKAGLTAGQLEEIQKQAYDEGLKLGKKEGYDEGLKEGREKGHQQGVQEGQSEIAQTVKYFEQIMSFLTTPIEQVNETVEEELIHLSMATAKQIIRREIRMDPGQIIAVIKDALSALPANSKKIKVYLHPSDAQIVRDNLKKDTEDQESETWFVIDEPNITRGGCQIKSEASQIDASIETRVAEIAARLLGSERVEGEHQNSEISDDAKKELEEDNE
ncbi:MAG: flagellar assembly protein FliH [Gammaproteobacteria bacterium]|nr:flagellar assembly protein FliH [Gammaproteobacteria bacterium]